MQREQDDDLAAPPRQHDPLAGDGGLHGVAPERPQAQRPRPPRHDARLHELRAVAEGLALQPLAADLAPAATLGRLQAPGERPGRVAGEDVAGAVDERAGRRRATCDALEEPGPQPLTALHEVGAKPRLDHPRGRRHERERMRVRRRGSRWTGR